MTSSTTATRLLILLSLAALACGVDHPAHEHAGSGTAPCCSADAPKATATASLPGTSLYLLDSEWADQTGSTRRLAEFQGEVVVTAMIFTHCEYACPRILADLGRIEAELPEESRAKVRFLLVSMDTERDTPEVLAAHAKQQGFDTRRWTLLHGDESAVRGYAAALGVRYKAT